VRREKLVAETGDSSGSERLGERLPLEAATKQRLIKTEKFMCAVVTVFFGVRNSVRLSQLFVVTSVSVQYIRLRIQTPSLVTLTT
jgi:hypothetical protein